MTLTLPTLVASSTKIALQTAIKIDRKTGEIQANLFWEIFAWIFFVAAPLVGLFIGISTTFVHDIIMVPTYAWNLL